MHHWWKYSEHAKCSGGMLTGRTGEFPYALAGDEIMTDWPQRRTPAGNWDKSLTKLIKAVILACSKFQLRFSRPRRTEFGPAGSRPTTATSLVWILASDMI